MGIVDDRNKPSSRLTGPRVVDNRDQNLVKSYDPKKYEESQQPKETPLPIPEHQAGAVEKAHSFLEGFLPGVTKTFNNILSNANAAQDQASAQQLQQGVEGLNGALRTRLAAEKDPEKRKILQQKIAANLGTIEGAHKEVADNPQYNKSAGRGLADLGQGIAEGASFVYGGPAAQAALQGGGALLGELGDHGKLDEAGVANSLLSGVGGALFGRIGQATGGLTGAVTRGIADVGLNAVAQGGIGVAREAMNREIAPDRASNKSYGDIFKEGAIQGGAFAGLFHLVGAGAAAAEGRAAGKKNAIIEDRPAFVDKKLTAAEQQKQVETQKAQEQQAYLDQMQKDIDNGIVNNQIQRRADYMSNPPEVRNSLIRDVVPPEGYQNPNAPAQNAQEGLPTRPVDSITGVPKQVTPEPTTTGNGKVDAIQAPEPIQMTREDAVKVKQSISDLNQPSKAKQERAQRTLAKMQDKYQVEPAVIAHAAMGYKTPTGGKQVIIDDRSAAPQEQAVPVTRPVDNVQPTQQAPAPEAIPQAAPQAEQQTPAQRPFDTQGRRVTVTDEPQPGPQPIEVTPREAAMIPDGTGPTRNSRFDERTTGNKTEYKQMNMKESRARAEELSRSDNPADQQAAKEMTSKEAQTEGTTKTDTILARAQKSAEEGNFVDAAKAITEASAHGTIAGREVKAFDRPVGEAEGYMLELANRRAAKLTTRAEGGKKASQIDQKVEQAKKEIGRIKITKEEVAKKIDDITCS